MSDRPRCPRSVLARRPGTSLLPSSWPHDAAPVPRAASRRPPRAAPLAPRAGPGRPPRPPHTRQPRGQRATTRVQAFNVENVHRVNSKTIYTVRYVRYRIVKPVRGRADASSTRRAGCEFTLVAYDRLRTCLHGWRPPARGGRRDPRCANKTRTTMLKDETEGGRANPKYRERDIRYRIHAASSGDWRPIQDACRRKAQPDADPRAPPPQKLLHRP